MNIQLRQLFDIVGESVDIDYSIRVDELREMSAYSLASPVTVKGKINNHAGCSRLS